MSDPISLYYCKGLDNFGDELSAYIVEKLAKRPVAFASSTENDKLVAVGSLLTYDVTHSNSIVWGTGTLTKNAVKIFPKLFPLKRSLPTLIRRLKSTSLHTASIRAVRGPLTRKALMNEGISCPEIYGDPAIIMPRIYQPNINTQTKVGLILHYSQECRLDSQILSEIENKNIKLISIKRVGDEQIESFIDEVCSCEKIFSTSLHGLIIAQAYGIPAQWIRVKGTPIHSDETHKFNDYFLGVNIKPQTPHVIELQICSISALAGIPAPLSTISNSVIDNLLTTFPY